jgi:exonuclease SbcC
MEAEIASMLHEAETEEAAADAAGKEAESFLAMKKRSEERRTALLQEKEQRAVLAEKVRTAEEAATRAAKVAEAMRQRLALLPGRPFDLVRFQKVKEDIACRRTDQEALARLRTQLARLPELEARQRKAEDRLTELEKRRAVAAAKIETLKGAEVAWREARQRADRSRADLEAARAQRARDEERISGLKERKLLAEDAARRAEKAAALAKERLDLMPQPDFDEARLESVRILLPALKKEGEALARLRADLARLPSVEAKLKAETERRLQLEERQAAAVKELAALEGVEEAWRAARKEAEDARRSVEVAAAGVREAAQLAKATAAQRHEVETQLKELDRLKAEEDVARARGEELQHLLEALKAFKADLTSRIVPMLSETASELLAELTGQRYARMQLDDDYEIHILDEGEEYPLARFSGGEADVASLCLRLAISRVIAERSGGGVNFLVLDEVFGSQDQERKRSILQLLEALRGQFPQILVITHIDDIKDMLSSVIAVSDDGSGGSRVKVS